MIVFGSKLIVWFSTLLHNTPLNKPLGGSYKGDKGRGDIMGRDQIALILWAYSLVLFNMAMGY